MFGTQRAQPLATNSAQHPHTCLLHHAYGPHTQWNGASSPHPHPPCGTGCLCAACFWFHDDVYLPLTPTLPVLSPLPVFVVLCSPACCIPPPLCFQLLACLLACLPACLAWAWLPAFLIWQVARCTGKRFQGPSHCSWHVGLCSDSLPHGLEPWTFRLTAECSTG